MSVPRVVAAVVLLVLGVVTLPLLASVLDGQGTENLILPAHLVVMAALGALAWRFTPAPRTAGRPPSPTRTLLLGAVVGVICAIVGLLVFFLLLSGFRGA